MPPKTKLFVGMLPPDCQEFTLRKLFERHGEVVECSIMGSYAFVHTKTEEQAIAAIEGLNQYDLNGYNISVEQSTGEKKSGGRGGGGGDRGGRGGGGRGGFRGGRGGDMGGGRGWGRGGGGPMRGGRDPYPPRDSYDNYRPSPYDRPGYDRRPLPPHPADRYGPLPPPPPMRNGGYDDYYDRAPPMERRAPPPYGRDPYDRYDAYDRRPPPAAPIMGARRSPGPMAADRRPIPTVPLTYDRRPEPYDVRPRDPYYSPAAPQRDLLYPQRVASPTAGRAPSPPRYGVPPPIRRY